MEQCSCAPSPFRPGEWWLQSGMPPSGQGKPEGCHVWRQSLGLLKPCCLVFHLQKKNSIGVGRYSILGPSLQKVADLLPSMSALQAIGGVGRSQTMHSHSKPTPPRIVAKVPLVKTASPSSSFLLLHACSAMRCQEYKFCQRVNHLCRVEDGDVSSLSERILQVVVGQQCAAPRTIFGGGGLGFPAGVGDFMPMSTFLSALDAPLRPPRNWSSRAPPCRGPLRPRSVRTGVQLPWQIASTRSSDAVELWSLGGHLRGQGNSEVCQWGKRMKKIKKWGLGSRWSSFRCPKKTGTPRLTPDPTN